MVSTVPRDAMCEILYYLSPSQTIPLLTVCKKWHHIINEVRYWKVLCQVQKIPVYGISLSSLKEQALTLRGTAWLTNEAIFADAQVNENNRIITETCIKIKAHLATKEFDAPEPFWIPLKYLYDSLGQSLKDTGDILRIKYYKRLTRLTIQGDAEGSQTVNFAQVLQAKIYASRKKHLECICMMRAVTQLETNSIIHVPTFPKKRKRIIS